jgi:hypothetical protein
MAELIDATQRGDVRILPVAPPQKLRKSLLSGCGRYLERESPAVQVTTS